MENKAERIKVLAVVGPTASGKTAVGVRLAEMTCGEVVSCDSMQIYRGMKIGTAAPGEDEMRGVPHHLIGFRDPRENYSVADYIGDAEAAAAKITSAGKTPVFVGGTGLYLDALLKVGSFSEAAGDPAVRDGLRAVAEAEGPGALHAMLAAVDPEAAAAIHQNNVKRVIRALEIYRVTGKTKTETDREAISAPPRFDADVILLDFRDRQTLYERIDRRCDGMIADGLEDEVRGLLASGMIPDGSTASQAIGYREMIAYIRGEMSLEEAAELIKKNTRNYAKRQLTWFRRYRDRAITLFVDGDGGAIRTADELVKELIGKLKK